MHIYCMGCDYNERNFPGPNPGYCYMFEKFIPDCKKHTVRKPKTVPGNLSNAAPGSNEWVPVAERLPIDELQKVIVCLPSGTVSTEDARAVIKWPNLFTHWMPLPETPKQ